MQVDRVLLCAPLIMLVRLGDTPSGTLSKLRKNVLWCNEQFEQVNEMTQDGGDNLESGMHDCWAARMPEFMSPVADAAYVLDPQWVNESNDAGAVTMENFWNIAKNMCCKGHGPGEEAVKWSGAGATKQRLMAQLQAF